jgi:hypothetical protein
MVKNLPQKHSLLLKGTVSQDFSIKIVQTANIFEFFVIDFVIFEKICFLTYCCGVDPDPYLDPDSMTLWIRICIRIELGFWIRIRIRIESIRIHNPNYRYRGMAGNIPV